MPADPITIEPALPEHEPLIRAQSAATNAAHHARLPHVFRASNDYQDRLLDAAFAPPEGVPSDYRSRIFVARRGTDTLGFALVIWNAPDPQKPGDTTALIADIATFDHARGQGVGLALLRHLAAQRQALGWDSLLADVWSGNDASHALFRKAGFDPERTEYRLGTPAPLPDSAQKDLDKAPARLTWTFIVIAALVIALIASIP